MTLARCKKKQFILWDTATASSYSEDMLYVKMLQLLKALIAPDIMFPNPLFFFRQTQLHLSKSSYYLKILQHNFIPKQKKDRQIYEVGILFVKNIQF